MSLDNEQERAEQAQAQQVHNGTINVAMGNLQPQLTIHRYGLRKYCVLPEGVDPGDAHGQYLRIGTRKACEAYIQECRALANARGVAAPPGSQPQPEKAQGSPDDPESYAAKVRQAYRELAEERQSEY